MNLTYELNKELLLASDPYAALGIWNLTYVFTERGRNFLKAILPSFIASNRILETFHSAKSLPTTVHGRCDLSPSLIILDPQNLELTPVHRLRGQIIEYVETFSTGPV
jgi:hypothetical protein